MLGLSPCFLIDKLGGNVMILENKTLKMVDPQKLHPSKICTHMVVAASILGQSKDLALPHQYCHIVVWLSLE